MRILMSFTSGWRNMRLEKVSAKQLRDQTLDTVSRVKVSYIRFETGVPSLCTETPLK